jgi:hypothetical protein
MLDVIVVVVTMLLVRFVLPVAAILTIGTLLQPARPGRSA